MAPSPQTTPRFLPRHPLNYNHESLSYPLFHISVKYRSFFPCSFPSPFKHSFMHNQKDPSIFPPSSASLISAVALYVPCSCSLFFPPLLLCSLTSFLPLLFHALLSFLHSFLTTFLPLLSIQLPPHSFFSSSFFSS